MKKRPSDSSLDKLFRLAARLNCNGRCGLCDTCQERNELELSKYEFDLIIDKIKELLDQNPMKPDELAAALEFPSEKSARVIRWLLDHQKLQYDNEHRLSWKH